MLLLSIESFAAVVSDNDGSAFITKAEFDSLKNNFQSQIDNYNTSIDSKIDGAIAAYLAGIRVAKATEETSIVNTIKESSVNGIKLYRTNSVIQATVAQTAKYNVSVNATATAWYNLTSTNRHGSASRGRQNSGSNDGAGTAWEVGTNNYGTYFVDYYSTYKCATNITYNSVYSTNGGSTTYTNTNPPTFNVTFEQNSSNAMNNVTELGNQNQSPQNGSGSIVSVTSCEQKKDSSKNIDGEFYCLTQSLARHTQTSDDFGVAITKGSVRALTGQGSQTFDASYWNKSNNVDYQATMNITLGSFYFYAPTMTVTSTETMNFAHKLASLNVGEEVKLYNGVPIFKATQKGKATMKIKLGLVGGSGTMTVAIDGKKFANEVPTKATIFKNNVTPGSYEFEMNVDSNEVVYLKAWDNDSTKTNAYVTVETESIVTVSE